MEKLSVQHGHHHGVGVSKPPVHRGGRGGRGGRGIKVVYISSPMKLTASAEEFRAVVQGLTGRDSNIADYDVAGGAFPAFARPVAGEGAAPASGRAAPEYPASGDFVVAPPQRPSWQDMSDQGLLYGQGGYW